MFQRKHRDDRERSRMLLFDAPCSIGGGRHDGPKVEGRLKEDVLISEFLGAELKSLFFFLSLALTDVPEI